MSVLRRIGAVIAVLALVAGVGVAVFLGLERRSSLESEAAEAASTYNATVAPPTTGAAPEVTVISDEFSTPSRTVVPVPVWPTIAGERLEQRLVVLGSPGAGYTVPPLENEFGGTFSSVASGVSPSSRVIVFFGGTNDLRSSSAALQSAAERAFDAAKVVAPDARLLVVGPATTSEDPSPDLLRVRAALERAAKAKDATFADPIAERWLNSSSGMLRADRVNLSAKAQQTLADRIEPLIADALG